jgi:hypothetical protein
MKDRIKELAIESKDSWGYENWERFAELIIQECAEVASRADDVNEDYPAWYLIEKHFEIRSK